MQKIAPCLWFDNQAEDAINYYISAFSAASEYCSAKKESKVLIINRYGDAGPGKKGKVMTGSFRLYGEEFMALNGGPMFKLTPSISFFVNCETADELNSLWKDLSSGGIVMMEVDKYPFSEKFGWVQDKFGVSWQLNLAPREQKIAPFLWFKDQAESAISLYTSLFKSSQVISINRFGEGDPGPKDKVKYAVFKISGQEFMAMDNNTDSFSLAISLFVNCETQAEVDELWEKLSDGGEKSQCGWLKDRFGVSWQIIPKVLIRYLSDPDPVKSQKVMQAMLKMNKIDIAELDRAYNS